MKIKAFVLSVDGKKYGPYPYKNRPKVAHLEHKKGITVETVWVQEGEVKATPPPQRGRRKTDLRHCWTVSALSLCRVAP